jgi:adenosylcobinamide-phosphate synthase
MTLAFEARWRGKVAGTVLALGLPTLWAAGGYGLLRLASLQDNAWLGWGLNCLLIYFCVACSDMRQHALRVLKALKQKDLGSARDQVAMIVGRDTGSLDEAGVLRACIESVAESACDGLVAPLFYAFLGGAPLALAHKAVSTLDSMIGHKHGYYRDFGWAAARLDDILNWIPARLTAALASLLAPLAGGSIWEAWTTAWRDAPKQPSPNSGWPEGAFAGALGIELGGAVSYKGVLVEKAKLGLARQPLSLAVGNAACRLFLWVALMAMFLGEGLTRVLG